MRSIQEYIHKIEEGEWAPWIRVGSLLLLLISVTVLYDLRETRNFSNPEAMDVAQVARNLSEGHGFSTHFIRPASVGLQMERAMQKGESPTVALRQSHPDISNPPLYPALLAVMMKLLPFEFAISMDAFLNREFIRHQPEVLIWVFNQLLFLVVLVQVYRLGTRLFDLTVAWLAALVFLSTGLYWKFSTSGLSTMLVLVIFLALINSLISLEEAGREEEGKRSGSWFGWMGLAAGALTGLGALTRYAFGWVMLPVLVFLGLFLGRQKGRAIFWALAGFVLTLGPWAVRNYDLSGTMFGTAGLSVYSQTPRFPGDTVERTLETGLGGANISALTSKNDLGRKLVQNLEETLVHDLPRLSGSWLAAFFLVALVIPYRNVTLDRLRWFLVLVIVVFVLAQSLGKTHLCSPNSNLAWLVAGSTQQAHLASPGLVVNHGNLLVLLGPAVFLFGAGFFSAILDQWEFDYPEMRWLTNAGLIAIASGPLLLTMLPPRVNPVVYPPYHPPRIQFITSMPDEKGRSMLREDDLMMSDIPWAVAWYGGRDCLWLPPRVQPDFFEINDNLRPIRGLYLTEATTDSRFVSGFYEQGPQGWGQFLAGLQFEQNLPDGFPLKSVMSDWVPGQWVLSDFPRWRTRPE